MIRREKKLKQITEVKTLKSDKRSGVVTMIKDTHRSIMNQIRTRKDKFDKDINHLSECSISLKLHILFSHGYRHLKPIGTETS